MAIKFVKKTESEQVGLIKKGQDLSVENLPSALDPESAPAEKSGRRKAKKATRPATEKDRELF